MATASFSAEFSSGQLLITVRLHASTLLAAKREATAWANERGPGTLLVYDDGCVPIATREVHVYSMEPWRSHA